MREKHRQSPFIRDILDYSKVDGYELLALIVMAEYSDLAQVRMGYKELARLARFSERKARECLKSLVEKGQLTVLEKGSGRGNRTRYHIHAEPWGDLT